MTASQIATLPSLMDSARHMWAHTARPRSLGTLLVVTDGYHAGASLDIENRAYTLGSDVNSDIVLADPGIGKTHLVLRRNGRQLDIEAVGGDVLLNDEELIPEGHGRSHRLPVRIKVGGAELAIEMPSPPAPLAIPQFPGPARPFIIAAVVVAGLLSLLSLAFALDGIAPSASQTQTRIAALSETDMAPTEAAPASTQAAVELRARIAQSGLSGLEVEEADGRLIVKGSMPGERSAEWTDIQAWYDRSFGTETVLSSSVQSTAAEAMPRLRLRAIWFGDNPYVISADGARYYEGASTNDGWTVAEIGEERLLLTKGSASIALSYP